MKNVCRELLMAALLASALGGASCASSDVPAAAHGKRGGLVGAPMPAVVVREVGGGRKIDLGALAGKVVLVDLWASWCAPCAEEMPLLDEMAARLKKKGVEIIAVSIDEDRASVRTFLESRGSWTLTVAHDPKGKVPERLQPAKMPTSYVVDAEGIIRYVNEGFERKDMQALEARLSELAGESS